jgi:flagellar basal-body rod modification protein FlgD
MASAVNALTSSSSSGAAASSSAGALDGSASDDQQVFLQLLVSQLQNQDPMNPTDSTQFVSELAQFSELEQTIAIRTDIETYAAQASSAAASQTNSTSQTQQA